MLKINELARLYLGVKKENEARTIYIDMSAWAQIYPDATVDILHQRQGDQTKYLTSATYDSETKVLSWTPTEYDTFYEGFGIAEIRMVEGNVVKKTKDLLVTAVSPSLIDGTGAVIESDYQAWLDEVLSYKNAAVTAKNAAEGYAEEAEHLIDVTDVAGAEAETLAPGSDATAEIVTTAEGKKFVFGIPKGDPADTGVYGIKMNGQNVQLDEHYVADLGSVVTDKSDKADKVTGGTSGNFAALDANGNLIDSGHKHSDYLTQHQDISGKADKVSSPTAGNFAALDANGNLTDSGHKHSDYLTQHQDISGKTDISSLTFRDFRNYDTFPMAMLPGDVYFHDDNFYKCVNSISAGAPIPITGAGVERFYPADEVIDLSGNLTSLGTITTGTISGSVSVPTGTPTEIGSITLQKGIWVIVASCDWGYGANGYRQIAFGDAVNPSRQLATTIATAGASKETYQQVVRIIVVGASTETVKLYAYHNNGSSINAYPYIYAVRVGLNN